MPSSHKVRKRILLGETKDTHLCVSPHHQMASSQSALHCVTPTGSRWWQLMCRNIRNQKDNMKFSWCYFFEANPDGTPSMVVQHWLEETQVALMKKYRRRSSERECVVVLPLSTLLPQFIGGNMREVSTLLLSPSPSWAHFQEEKKRGKSSRGIDTGC